VVVAYPEIQAAYWQPKLAHLGEIVEDVDDIHQCIVVILTTQKGSDPYRPDFAVDLMASVDRPLSDVRARLISEILESIARWERRCRVLQVEVTATVAGKLSISVAWVPVEAVNTAGQVPQTTVEQVASTSAAPDAVAGFVSIPFAASLTLTTVDGGTF